MSSRVEEFTEGGSATLKARQLLCEILPEAQRKQFLATESFDLEGNLATYRICRRSKTELYSNGQLIAYACLQLSTPAPHYDRMIAEYLILNSEEGLYWKKANVLPAAISSRMSVSTVLLVLINAALLLNLVATYVIGR